MHLLLQKPEGIPLLVEMEICGFNGNAPDDDNSLRLGMLLELELNLVLVIFYMQIVSLIQVLKIMVQHLLIFLGLLLETNINVRVLPGTYYISVQAIDGGNVGGPFSEEVSVDADYPWNAQRLGGIIDRRLLT